MYDDSGNWNPKKTKKEVIQKKEEKKPLILLSENYTTDQNIATTTIESQTTPSKKRKFNKSLKNEKSKQQKNDIIIINKNTLTSSSTIISTTKVMTTDISTPPTTNNNKSCILTDALKKSLSTTAATIHHRSDNNNKTKMRNINNILIITEQQNQQIIPLVDPRKQPLQPSDITDVTNWYNFNTTTQQSLDEINRIIVVSSSTVDFTLRKFLCLRERQWLNDEVINFYMDLLGNHYNNPLNNALSSHYYYSSFFFAKLYFDHNTYNYEAIKKWSKKVNVFEQEKLFFPIIYNSHWTLAVIFMHKKEIHYYDSMMGNNSNNDMGIIIFDSLLHWMKDVQTKLIWSEELQKNVERSAITTLQVDRTQQVDWTQWRLVNTDINDVPQQVGGNDCGVFIIMFADYISNNINLKNAFHQSDIKHFRMMIAASILKNRLIYYA
jgi:Ulp1 family protease